jgi:hypothetical protein
VLLEIASPLLERFTKPILIIPGLQAFARDVERRYQTILSPSVAQVQTTGRNGIRVDPA